MSPNITRRTLLKGALGSALVAPFVGSALVAPFFAPNTAAASKDLPGSPAGPETPYDFDQYPEDFQLFGAPGLPGGGQLEVRQFLSLDIYLNPQKYDPDDVAIAKNLKWFNPQSWYDNYFAMGQKNEALATGTPANQNKYYRRAANYYKSAVNYLSEYDPRMLPTYLKLVEMYNKAWTVVPPSSFGFERIEIPFEGNLLQGEFYSAGQGAPCVVAWQGADSIMLGGSPSGGPWTSRGMSYLTFDQPGDGGSLRLQNLFVPPDEGPLAHAAVDYLKMRGDVDLKRLGIYGSSWGGYRAPQVCAVTDLFKACGFWSGAFESNRDLNDYFVPIRDKMRWIIGAKNLQDAHAKLEQYTLKNIVQHITAALMVGYSVDDRVMNHYGALELYDKAVNAVSREQVQGTGHAGPNSFSIDRTTFFANWFQSKLV